MAAPLAALPSCSDGGGAGPGPYGVSAGGLLGSPLSSLSPAATQGADASSELDPWAYSPPQPV
eukprot:2546635-Alexandrium_andersonii.AAC.1